MSENKIKKQQYERIGTIDVDKDCSNFLLSIKTALFI